MPKPDSMRCDRKDFDYDINELYGFAIDHLPEGWRIELYAVEGEVSMSLETPEGKDSGFWPDDEDHIGHWVGFINYAREVEGMDEVSWDEHEQYS